MRGLIPKYERELPVVKVFLETLASSVETGRTSSGERVYPGEVPQLLEQLADAQRVQGRTRFAADLEPIARRLKQLGW